MPTPPEGPDNISPLDNATAQNNMSLRSRDVEKREDAGQESPSTEDPEAGPEDNKSNGRTIRGVRWILICTAIYTTCMLYGLDTTIAADVQAPIIEALGHVEQLAWVGAGFPLGSVCVILLLGKLYEMFNTKWNFMAAVVLFEAGSALCGAAPTMNALIVGRVITGMGGSGIYLGSLQYVAIMTGEKERGFYMSLVGAFWGLGSVLGPVIGGAFTESPATWRWAFYINLPIGAFAIVAFILFLPPFHPIQGVTIQKRLATLDFVGFILGCGTWVTFLLAFTMAGSTWPWNDGRTIATLVVFGVLLVSYILQQYFAIFTTPSRRLFPGHLLRDRTQVLLYVVTAAGTTSLFVVVYYLPIYFQFVNGDNAIMAAVRLLPFVCITVAVSISAGSFLHLIKVYMAIYIIGGIFLIAGGGPLMVYLDTNSTAGLIYGMTILIAVGSGLSMTIAYTIATLTLESEDVGAGLSLQNVSQIGGQVIALAIAGQIYQSTGFRNLSEVLAGYGYTDSEIQGAVAGAQSDLFSKLSGELREEAVIAITKAMQMTFVLVPVAGGIMLIAALCMKREKLFG
ncbi:major facilitator superfamily domain-containing protein [Hypoxylon fragiforme]|uniref:major facilitator superfamily domain-containing protein n=1 Tax=Hypoxylon fragiforme TaxID=63214 RepID=UPI0020C66448|nr:major facilitator superfamily domain-containing protein [Hypoxylon fragiforme]KAI2609867.1 major facilitator superfamily domain-containing protein [Hypoxylon fragiforme]